MDGNVTPINNVIDITTGKAILPKKVRATLMGQYVESKMNDHSPEEFLSSLEKRILGDLAMAGVKFVQDALNSTTAPSSRIRR